MNTTIDTPSPDRPASGQGTPAYARVPASYYDIFVGVFIALLILSGVTAAKLFYGPTVPVISDLFYDGGPLIFDGGAFLFPFAYIVGDILAEVYGWRRARRARHQARRAGPRRPPARPAGGWRRSSGPGPAAPPWAARGR